MSANKPLVGMVALVERGMCLVGNTGVGGAARYRYNEGHHSQFAHESDNADGADECRSDAAAHRSVAADTPPHCHREYPLRPHSVVNNN